MITERELEKGIRLFNRHQSDISLQDNLPVVDTTWTLKLRLYLYDAQVFQEYNVFHFFCRAWDQDDLNTPSFYSNVEMGEYSINWTGVKRQEDRIDIAAER